MSLKYKILFIILIICFQIQIKGATIQSNSSGNWNNTSTWVGGIIPGVNDNIEIINGHSITINTNVSITDITITNGSITIGSNTLSIYGIISGQTSNISSTSSSTLEINDNGSSPIFTIPTNISKLKKLVMNRANGAQTDHYIDLDDAVPADSIVLVLTNGILYMNNGSILYMNSHSIKRNIPCSDNSHVDGAIQRDIKKNSGFHVFPVGDNGIARPMSLAAQNGTNNINQVQFYYATPPNNTNVNFSKLPGGIFQNFYWDHQLVSSSNTQRRLKYENSDFPGIEKSEIFNHIYLANSNGTADWDTPTTPRDVDTTNKWISFTNSNASNDRYWTFGSDDASVRIDNITLPIELGNWDAENQGSYVELDWTTYSELNNHFFEIERSDDGENWYSISTIMGAGTSSVEINYSDIDQMPFPYLSYYKLKQTDYNGKYTYSDIETVNRSENEDGYIQAIYNKNDQTITIQASNLEISDINIFNTAGNCLTNNVTISQLSPIVFLISITNLSEGIYIIQTNDNSTMFYKK